MKKKAISLIMILAMVLSLMPTFALADTTVAMIGSQNYATLAEAVAAAKDGDTITLQTDTSETLPVPSIANLTIDLGNHKLTMLNSETMVISGGKELTLQNGSVVSTVFTDGTKSNFNILTGSSMTLNKVKFDTTGVALYPRGDAAKVTVTDSEIKCGVYAVATNAATAANYNVVITLTNSTFTSTYGYNKDDASDKYDSCPVMINVPGTLNMTGCTVNGTRQGVLVRGGTAAIKNSTINLDAEFTTGKDKYWTANWGNGDEVPMAAVVVGNRNTGYKYPASCTLEDTTVTTTSDYKAIYVYGMDAAERLVKLDIKGNSNVSGPITKEEAASGAALVSISGGYFTSDPTSYKAEGAFIFTSDKAGYNYLVSSTGAASFDTTQYASVQEAVNAVARGKTDGTVTMERNSTENVTILAGTTVTLDLNGKTLTNTGDYDTITNNGTLTVIGSGNVNNDGKQTAALLNNGTATLKGGTFKRTNAVDDGAIRWYVVQNHGIMTLDGATIEQATKNTASALINGWSGYTEKDTIPSSATAAAATLTITSGTVLNGGHTLKQCSTAKGGGTFTVNGGTFTCESSADVLAADADVTVNGGNFSGPLNARTGSISVTGGCYTVDPADYVAAGYKAVSGGYTVGSTIYSYKVSAVPANKIESVTAEAYKDDDADVQTEVIATVSGSTITVSGKLPSDDNKVVITYTCTDNTTGTATLNYANGAFTAAALTVGTTTYTINFDSLSVLSAEVKVAAPAVPAVSPVADNASDVEKDAVTEINRAIAPEASSHPSAEGLAAAVADSALETTTDAQGNTVTNVTTSAGTQTATQIIADKQVTIEDNAATGLIAIRENSTDNPAVVTVVPVMKIAVTGADIVDGKQTLTLDITAMSQVVVTTKNVAGANINTTAGDSGQNAIAVGDPLEVTVNTPVTIKVPIPKILYDNAPLYIKHTHNNIPETVLAELSYSAAYYATFELSGLSEVTFLSDPRTCTINYYSDETGTDYESKTITPADTGNANGYMTMPTVTAPTGKTFSGWKLTATTSGGQATTDYTGTYTEFTDDMLTYFAGTTITARPVFTAKSTTAGESGASPTFTITVNKSDNGTVTSSAASAAASATVTLTVAPATGYVLDALTVTDSTTKAVATAKVSDTSYTFTMPALNVTVTPTFKKTSAHVSAKFTDVDPKGWYVDAIDYVVTKGLFNGITDTTFEPDSAMDRAMLVTVMYRLAGSPAVTGTHSFTDVPADAYYKTALLWAVQNKVVNGITDTTFGPTLPVTREQVAAILYRYAKANGADVSIGEDTNILSYDDAFEISEYAIPAFQWACGSGILQGDNNKLMPKNNATRAQIAAIMMRSAGKLTK